MFAGQGAQKPGMGKDIYENNSIFRDVVDKACAVFEAEASGDSSYEGHTSLKEVMFEDAELINRTRFTQPAMAAFAAGVVGILKDRGLSPDVAAGLSLGEYSALYAAGVFDLETLISLLSYRGKVMEEASAGVDCAMSAVLGLTAAQVEDAVARGAAASGKIVEVSNYNATGQIVIAGEEDGVSASEAAAKELGAKRCMRLNVSGPFHTSFMEGASVKLSERLSEVSLGKTAFPVIYNVTGKTGADGDIPSLLERQIKSPVRMAETILNLREMGVERIVEIGPGKTIAGFVRRTAKEIEVISINTLEDIDRV